MRHCRAKISFVVFLLFLALEVWNSSFASPLLKSLLSPNLNPQNKTKQKQKKNPQKNNFINNLKISKQINENFPNIFWTATEENNKVGEILKELIPDVWLGKRDLWRLDLSAFKKVLEAEDDNNIMIKEEGGIKVEESEQIATDWNSIVSRNNGRPSIPILSNLINNGREGGICALRASVFLTHKLVGMALYNCDAYSGNSGKYVWMDRLIIENNLTGKLNGEETVIAILAKMVAVAKEMKAECIEWTDDSNELANYGKLLHSLGAVNMKEINGEQHLYRWDVNKYYLLREPVTYSRNRIIVDY